MKNRLNKLERAAERRFPIMKETRPLKIYKRHIDLAGKETWEGPAPVNGEDGPDRLILTIVQTKPDPVDAGQNRTI